MHPLPHGSESRIVPMTARTVTVDDIASLKSYSRCVDMSSVFGGGLYSYSASYSASDNYRKTRVMGYIPPLTNRWALVSGEPEKSCYLLFYNLSPNLPVNLNVAGVIGLTEAYLKFKKRLFWKGDVVALKLRPEGKNVTFRVESLDADICEVGLLEDFLRKQYQDGPLERVLGNDELQCERESGFLDRGGSFLMQSIPISPVSVGLLRYCLARRDYIGVQTLQRRKVNGVRNSPLLRTWTYIFRRTFSTRPQRATMCYRVTLRIAIQLTRKSTF